LLTACRAVNGANVTGSFPACVASDLAGARTVDAFAHSAVDTGTTLIYVPSAVAAAFYAAIPGSANYTGSGSSAFRSKRQSGSSGPTSQSSNAGVYQYPCSFNGTVGLTFANISAPLLFNTTALNIGEVTAGTCVGAVMGADIRDANKQLFAIVGDTFVRPGLLGAQSISADRGSARTVDERLRALRLWRQPGRLPAGDIRHLSLRRVSTRLFLDHEQLSRRV
jgi:hypothetical protein